MLRHWQNKVFKDGVMPYTFRDCVMIGFQGRHNDVIVGPGYNLEEVVGDLVFFMKRENPNGTDDSVVVFAICSDGIFIKDPSSNTNSIITTPIISQEDYVDVTYLL